MKILFLIFHGFEKHNGISKKIHYQMEAFKECNAEVHLCYFTDQAGRKCRWMDNDILNDYGQGFKAKILKRTAFEDVVKYVRKENISLVYVRHDHNANPFTIHLLKQLQATGAKIVLEIPTYPYDQEYRGFPLSDRFYLLIDKCFRRQMVHYVDKIVTFSDHKTIWGKPTIQLSNGIDFSSIKLKKQFNTADKELHLIGVAEVHYWHGFDRIMSGLTEYYRTNPSYKVYFHIIGNTGEKDRKVMQEIISAGKIESYVLFHGAMHGEELDAFFDKTDMGIGSLGRHRSGITNIKTLKNREYAARGIPFVYSETDSDFDSQPYVLKVPADESTVSITKIINFYQSRQWQPQEIRNSVKELSWQKQMKKVLDAVIPLNKKTTAK